LREWFSDEQQQRSGARLDLGQFAGPGNSVKQLAAIRVFERNRQMGLCQEHLHANVSEIRAANADQAVEAT
jgi:hypothetical protein